MISATMVIETCDHLFRPKSQLVRYPNCETMGNNDKQGCVIVSATNEETPYEQLLHNCFFFFFNALKIIHSVFLVLFSLSNKKRFDHTF